MLANVLYLILILLVSPILLFRAYRGGRYRRGLNEKVLGLSASKAESLWGGQPAQSPKRWFHAVSVGEVNLLVGLIKKLNEEGPNRYVISTSTDTGYDLAVQHFGSERVFFCPLDFTWAVSRTINHLQPTELILIELELWPNLIRSAKQNGCKVSVVNARLSQRSSKRYQQFSRFTRPLFASLDWVGCQDQEVLEHFHACGTPKVRLEITGSLKFDNAPLSRATSAVEACRSWAGLTDQHVVWLVGSTQPGEEAMALSIYKTLMPKHPSLRLILVPRHPQRFDEVDQLIRSFELVPRRRSKVSEQPKEWLAQRVTLVDTIGELRNWWGTAQIATVGGSFGSRGGQNMLEPAGYGCAVSFGPDTRNFKQISQTLLDANASVRVNNETELLNFVTNCLRDSCYRESLGARASKTVRNHRGAIDRTCNAITQHTMPSPTPPTSLVS